MRARGIRWRDVGVGLMIALTSALAGCSTSGKGSDGPINVVGTSERPANTTAPGDSMFGSGKLIRPKTYQTKSIDPKMAKVNGERSEIVISELNEKKVTALNTIDVTTIENEVTTSPSKDVVVTTTGDGDFQKIIQRYQKGRDDPIEPGMSNIEAGRDAVTLAEINRYADSTDVTDKDGIPVEKPVGTNDAKTSDSVIRD